MKYLIVHTENANFDENVEYFGGSKGVGISKAIDTIEDLIESGWIFMNPITFVNREHPYKNWDAYFVWHFYKE